MDSLVLGFLPHNSGPKLVFYRKVWCQMSRKSGFCY